LTKSGNSNGNGNGNGRSLSLSSTVQVGALGAIIAVFAYVLQPIRAEITEIKVRLEQHDMKHGHTGVLADMATLKEQVITGRSERESALESIQRQLDELTKHIDNHIKRNESQELRMMNMLEKIARLEAKTNGVRNDVGRRD
jgi:hypothetical protein